MSPHEIEINVDSFNGKTKDRQNQADTMQRSLEDSARQDRSGRLSSIVRNHKITAKSKELLTRYSVARIPFIAINTIEPSRTLDILKEISEQLQLPFCVHTLTKGVYDLTSDKTLCDDKSVYGAVDYMTEQMKRKQYQTIVLTEVPDLTSGKRQPR